MVKVFCTVMEPAVLLFLIWLVSVDAKDFELAHKRVGLPFSKMTEEEIKNYAKNVSNSPRLDFTPTGTQPQPVSAGKSYDVQIKQQIIGGVVAKQKQFPWQVYIVVDNSWLCGGSLISPIWVLTAAHCVDGGSTFQVTAGGIERRIREIGEQTLTSNEAIPHEQHDSYFMTSDIALIKMSSPFILTQYVNVVTLPRISDAEDSFSGRAVLASGYGMAANTGPASRYMRFVWLKVATNAECASFFGPSTVCSSCICTSGDKRRAICNGDSGGPLLAREPDGRFAQIGIVSFGATVSCTKYPSGFSRVTSFLGWISNKTNLAIRP